MNALRLDGYYITDRVGGPTGLPLHRLLKLVAAEEGAATVWDLGEVEGYGVDVCALDDAQSTRGTMPVPRERILALADCDEQWFYWLVCADPDLGITFGLFDSGGLFVVGDPVVSARLAGEFASVSEFELPERYRP